MVKRDGGRGGAFARQRHSVLSPGQIRLEVIPDFLALTLHCFVKRSTIETTMAVTDGRVVGSMAAHIVLPWIHRVISNLKRLVLGVYHGFRPRHIQAYLDEFVFRWNRGRRYRSTFYSLLGIELRVTPMIYRILVNGPVEIFFRGERNCVRRRISCA